MKASYISDGYQNRGLVVIALHQIFDNLSNLPCCTKFRHFLSPFEHTTSKIEQPRGAAGQARKEILCRLRISWPMESPKIFMQLITGQALAQAAAQNTPTSRA
jgi:hypothetical protein